MNISDLRNAYKDNKIEKRLFLTMLRERLLPLIECQKSIKESDDDYSIEINGQDIILNRDGMRMAFDFSQTICRAEWLLAFGGNPEQKDFDYIGTLIKSGDIVFDIGANVGLVSLSILKSQPKLGRIYAFEPLPDTFAKMKHNLELNNNPVNIHPINLGMSDKEGTFEFFLPGAAEAASMKPNMDDYWMRESVDGRYTGKKKMDKVECRVKTVDKYVEENNIDMVNFMKIDVEGNEKNVLLGSEMVLKKHKPIIYCEMLRKHAARFGYHPNDIIEYMNKMNYSCYTYNKELVKFYEMTDDTIDTNFFFFYDR